MPIKTKQSQIVYNSQNQLLFGPLKYNKILNFNQNLFVFFLGFEKCSKTQFIVFFKKNGF